jgi:hypothetical protein
VKIRICKENEEQIQQELDRVQNRAKARVMDIPDLYKLTHRFEKILERLPNTQRSGIVFTYREVVGCNSYKYNPKTTEIKLKRGTKDWFLTSVYRIQIHRSKSQKWDIKLPESTIKWIQDKMIKDITNWN